MFSSGFLSGANPLSAVSSAVSSASIPKFSLFGDDEEEQSAKQEGKPLGPQSGAGKGPPQQGVKPSQQGPPKGQGPSQQQQGPKPGGPGPQQQGPKPGGPGPQQQGPKPGGPGPQQQGPKPGGPGPQQQGPKPGGPGPQPGVAGKPSGPQQQGKPGLGAQSEGPGKTGPAQGKAMCPLCKSTELNVKVKDQPPNYNTCTQCKQQVCSLCGFSPPDSAVRDKYAPLSTSVTYILHWSKLLSRYR